VLTPRNWMTASARHDDDDDNDNDVIIAYRYIPWAGILP